MLKLRHIMKYLGIVVLAVVMSSDAFAEGSDTRPDLNGVWVAFASYPPFVRGGPSPLSENGEAIVNEFYAKYGDDYVEPGAYCVPPGMPSTMTSIVGYPIEILQSEDRITILAEMEMQVRRIYMDGRKIPENYPVTRMGYSVGSWDGDTLVIDTALLKDSPLRSSPRSQNTRIQERIYLTKRSEIDARPSPFITIQPISDNVLVLELTLTDSTLYKEPRKTTIYYQKIKDDAILEYDCPSDLWQQALDAVVENRE